MRAAQPDQPLGGLADLPRSSTPWGAAHRLRHQRWVENAKTHLGEPIEGALVGQVIRTYRMGMDVHLPSNHVVFGTTDDKFRDPLNAPASGDWVVVSFPGERNYPAITPIGHRDSVLVRRDPADRATPQVLAANVDVVAIVHGADRPVNPKRLWRALAVSGGSGAQVIMVLTKADLPDASKCAAQLRDAAPSIALYETAGEVGLGVEPLRAALSPDAMADPNHGEGRTMVLIGESGAGKSSLVNALLDDHHVQVGAVRDHDRKGRHTTTHRVLLYLDNGGAVLDTPGVRAIGMWPGYVDCALPFDDVAQAAQACKFANCTHRHEPGCGVRQALAEGALTKERLDACFDLIDEEAAVARQLETKHWR